MLNAHAIYRRLIEDEPPAIPDDPADMSGEDIDAQLDPKTELTRYADEPFRVPGNGPTDLYQDFLDQLAGRDSRKIANNTYVLNHGDRLAVRLHQTDVVTAFPDGKIVIDTKGWHPKGSHVNHGWRAPVGSTSQNRINSNLASGWKIYQKGHKNDTAWFWYNIGTGAGKFEDEAVYPYTDGDTIYPDGSLKIQAMPVYRKVRRRKVA